MDKLDQITRQNIAILARTYGRLTGKSMAAVSKEIYGNTSFLDQYLSGEGGLTVEKLQNVLTTFRAKWPDGESWPMLQVIVFEGPARQRRRRLSPKKKAAA